MAEDTKQAAAPSAAPQTGGHSGSGHSGGGGHSGPRRTLILLSAMGIPAGGAQGHRLLSLHEHNEVDRVDRAAVPEGHAAASGNIFARRRFASFASKRWT